jgi:beta-lactamase class A
MKVLLVLITAISMISFLIWNRETPPKTLGKETKLSISPIEEVISKSLGASEGIYAVVFKNLRTNETYHLNDQRKFETGSLYKLWILGEVFDQTEKGLIGRNETLSDSINSLNARYGSTETTEGMATFALQDAIKEMIILSNNYAAFLLTDRITMASASGFLAKYNFKDSRVGGENLPTTTALDIASFFEKLYKGQLVNFTASAEMLNILKKQQLNQKMPKYLPPETKIAHKTGEVGDFSHDAGIIFTDKGDYILVILSETELPGYANEQIAKLSKVVYEYVIK